MATNTIPAGVKLDTVLEYTLYGYRYGMLPVHAFAHNFQKVPLKGTNKVQVPYYPAHTDASQTRAAGASIKALAKNTSFSTKEITVDQALWQVISFTAETKSYQPAFDPKKHGFLMGYKLAQDVIAALLAKFTISAFPNFYAQHGEDFDDADVRALRVQQAGLKWNGNMKRSLLLPATYTTGILGSTKTHDFGVHNNPRIFEEAEILRVAGHDIHETEVIPHNSQDLAGIACTENALLVAFAPIEIDEPLRRAGMVQEIIMDDESDLTLEYFEYAEPDTLETVQAICCHYGAAAGEPNAAIRIVDADAGSGA